MLINSHFSKASNAARETDTMSETGPLELPPELDLFAAAFLFDGLDGTDGACAIDVPLLASGGDASFGFFLAAAFAANDG